MLTEEIKVSISESVLCWLATCNDKGEPNCSPKEAYTFNGSSELVIANIASPESVENIQVNPNVCVSFVHVFKQKGFKLKGQARYIPFGAPDFPKYMPLVKPIVGEIFQVKGFIVVSIKAIATIIAPAYYMVKGTTEASQINSAKKTYGV
jgi:predicted pyridoxine 5'-phosphate oxidase superfamily flavin-nucleotide-binding protein